MKPGETAAVKSIKKSAELFYGFITDPAGTSEALCADKDCLPHGFRWTLFYGLCYMLASLFFYILHFTPRQTVFLSVSPEKWYLVQSLTVLPAVFAGVAGFAGLSVIFARMAGGKGSFEKAFPVLSFTLLVPSFIFVLIPEIILFPFLYDVHSMHKTALPFILEAARVFILPGALAIILSVPAISRICKLDYIKSAAVFFISSLPYVMITAVFIR